MPQSISIESLLTSSLNPADDLLHRQKERQRREREERKREQHINEINDRQMGKLIASAANLNLNSSHEFPTVRH